MAPCFWQQNLTLHNSQIADELRARAGRWEDETKSSLIEKYGERILALPKAAKGFGFPGRR
jgi:hypothetical protein